MTRELKENESCDIVDSLDADNETYLLINQRIKFKTDSSTTSGESPHDVMAKGTAAWK